MSDIPNNGWCDSHRERLASAGDAQMVVETLIITRAMETGRWPPSETGCWVCGVTEDDFQAAMREGTVLHAKVEAFGGPLHAKVEAFGGPLHAKVEAFGGPYTAAGIALSLGKKE